MTSRHKGIGLKTLTFTGADANSAELIFQPGLNVLYGASNTGKSFVVKSLDFMLGSSRELPDIVERRLYDRAHLGLALPNSGPASLVRALAGGALDLFSEASTAIPGRGHNGRQMSARHDSSNTDNLSQFLLEELGLGAKSVAADANGKKRSLSFRDLARYCIVDETSIQSETSPVESGQYQLATVERSVFKLLVTGVDDAAIVPVVDRKTFRASTAGKLEVLDEMIASITEQLDADHPNSSQLADQYKNLEDGWTSAQQALQESQDSIRSRLTRKSELADAITSLQERHAEIEVNLGRFRQLTLVYKSDIERLEAIEEAGFLLTLSGGKDCPLCGASTQFQQHVHGEDEIERAREAARVEIEKINRQALDLQTTLIELDLEGQSVEDHLTNLDGELYTLEQELARLAPAAETLKQRLDEILAVRDRVRQGLSLIDQRQSLQGRRDELAAVKPAAKAQKPKLGVSSTAVHDFAQAIGSVLTDWHFPGKRHVTFDDSTYDLRIDGKHRKDNGKGVRAITHAAFKVGLLLYCKERDLPHPGFLVLDTPLLTYRDPLQSRGGPLGADEEELRASSVKDYFFEHLSRHGESGQFVVVENIDLPRRIGELANVETFSGDRGVGRGGLFVSY